VVGAVDGEKGTAAVFGGVPTSGHPAIVRYYLPIASVYGSRESLSFSTPFFSFSDPPSFFHLQQWVGVS
jgi:hypothetical protein